MYKQNRWKNCKLLTTFSNFNQNQTNNNKKEKAFCTWKITFPLSFLTPKQRADDVLVYFSLTLLLEDFQPKRENASKLLSLSTVLKISQILLNHQYGWWHHRVHPWIKYISKCTEQEGTFQGKLPLEGICPQILRIIKIRRLEGEVKGFDDRRTIITAKSLVHPLCWVVLPVVSPQEKLLAGHFHLHHKKALKFMLMK